MKRLQRVKCGRCCKMIKRGILPSLWAICPACVARGIKEDIEDAGRAIYIIKDKVYDLEIGYVGNHMQTQKLIKMKMLLAEIEKLLSEF